MPSERVERRIDALLDEADTAISARQWDEVTEKARAVLAIDAKNEDAAAFLQMANGAAAESAPTTSEIGASAATASTPDSTSAVEGAEPESFAGGRYQVLRFLGEGGKKRVFLAHDALLDRDIAFSLIKTDGLDEVGRERIMREAQAMGRLSHQNIVSIYDIGEHTTADGSKQPYLVQELMGGGDVEDLLEDAEGGLPLPKALEIGLATARGLEFAHAHGVIHRDLKPGNVWLTTDGIAKIGDLGLAMTMGQTRLTSHGMMVGTYGYMPPEQALGQEVTAQADLYSLGAMLYELVTGRPPFQGDTPTAVISQHLNTQPVAPGWHSDHCPPDLESLILQLLAKVPADRPASATEVIATLEAVDPDARSTSHSDSAANPLARLARGIFVGRERELDQLRSALDDALQGRGSIVMLVGEPGIGKTRTTQELETYARMRGAEIYWGRARETSGAPPYYPWIQIGNAWSQQNDLAALQWGANANELVRLFPQLAELVPGIQQPDDIVDAASAQFLLFDAFSSFLREATAHRPGVLVLDDLHWADKPTLLLLTHLAAELSNMPLLIIGTYRDTDLVRTHPLSETLAGLNREGAFLRVVLKGLNETEVASYVSQRAGVAPSPALLDRIFEETEGNPFFLSEIVNLMAQEGSLAQAGTGSISDIALPDGVRETLGRRLDRLSEAANELLGVASIIGREFAYETLTLVADHDPDALLLLIEEALDAHVIEESERPGRYRFTHALMQETLLDELSATRKLRLHGQIAEAFEHRWNDPTDDQVLVLAPHFTESAALNKDHAPRAIRYSQRAAQAAERQSAWDEAARHYDAVLALHEDTPDPDLDEAQLLTLLGAALRDSAQQRRAWATFMQAIDIYRTRADSVGLATAVEQVTRIIGPPHRIASLLDEAFDAVGGVDPHLEALLLARITTTRTWAWRSRSSPLPEGFDQRLKQALRLARERGDLQAEALLASADCHRHADRGEFDSAEWARAHTLLDAAGLSADAAWAIQISALALPLVGDTRAGVGVMQQAIAYADRKGIVEHQHAARSLFAALSLLCGDLDDIDRTATALNSSPTYIARTELSFRLVIAARFDEAIAALPPREMGFGIPIYRTHIHWARMRVLSLAGRHSAAQEEHKHWREALDAIGPLDDLGGFGMWLLLAASSVIAFADEQFIQDAYRQLCTAPYRDYAMPLDERGAHVARGDIALHLGKIDEAESHYLREIALSERERLPFALGAAHQGLAEVAEGRGDIETAREHLDAAGEIFSQYGAKLYLDQIIAKKEILQA